MAKVKAPLFSIEARGSLAKSIVYFPWKGVDAVRSHVVPANPNTALQDAQRTHLENAVDEWHEAGYTETDKSAWNRLANLAAGAMSGFNRLVQAFIAEAVLGGTWTRIYQGQSADPDSSSFAVSCKKVSGGLAPTIRYGKSPTSLLSTAVMVDQTGDTWFKNLTGLSADTLYYFTIDVGVAGATFGRLGIYSQRTTE